MTSLTPYQDAARAVIAQVEADLGEQLVAPDEMGMRNRVNLAVSRAMILAVSAELDGGFSHEELDIASIVALADLICSLVTTDAELDTRSPEALARGLGLLDEVATNLRRRLGPQGSDRKRTARVETVAGGSA